MRLGLTGIPELPFTFKMADVFTCTKRTSDKIVFQVSRLDSLFTMSCRTRTCQPGGLAVEHLPSLRETSDFILISTTITQEPFDTMKYERRTYFRFQNRLKGHMFVF